MSTGAEIFNMILSGAENGRARREEGYLRSRREIEDPYKDKELARVDTARDAIVGTYGPMAGDPASYSSVQATDEQVQKLPGELKNQDLDIRIREMGIQDRINTQTLGAMQNILRGVSGQVKQGKDPAEALAAIPARAKAALGLTAEDETQMVEALRANPEGIDGLVDLLGDPEAFQQLLEIDVDGKPMYATLGERGTVRQLDVAPYTDPLEREKQLADIDAARALAAQRRTTKAGSGDGEGEDPLAMDAFKANLDDLRSLIRQGAATGTFVVQGADPVNNALASAATSEIGQAAQRMLGTPEQNIRNQIRALVPNITNTIRQATNMGVRMLDTEKEYQRFIEMVNNMDADTDAMLAAVDRLERTFYRELGSTQLPQTATGSGTSTAAGGGTLTQQADGSFKWTPE